MTARLFLLVALTIGLAFGSSPVPTEGCAFAPCSCAPLPDGSLCCSSDEPPASDESRALPATSTLKQTLSPALILVGVAPSLTVERPAMRRLLAARTPVPPRLALLCTRLI